ncbi:BrnT family toxin [bacterium]|nr:BrnT family toxin [bacterium]
MGIRFEWDEKEAVRNQRKLGIAFEDVQALFTSGVDYLEIYDREHSLDEDRFICIGLISSGIVLAVVTEAAEGLIRIVSARRATRRESTLYADFLKGKRP